MELKYDTVKSTLKAFEIYKLVDENDPILRTPPQAYNFQINKTKAPYIAESLFETMFANKGVGLSANQVGLDMRVFVAGFDKANKQVFFNPEILEVSAEYIQIEEGCLSYPGLFLKVKRPSTVKLKFQHVDGTWKEETYNGLTARVILHEMMHMDGELFTKSTDAYHLEVGKKKRKKLQKVKKHNTIVVNPDRKEHARI